MCVLYIQRRKDVSADNHLEDVKVVNHWIDRIGSDQVCFEHGFSSRRDFHSRSKFLEITRHSPQTSTKDSRLPNHNSRITQAPNKLNLSFFNNPNSNKFFFSKLNKTKQNFRGVGTPEDIGPDRRGALKRASERMNPDISSNSQIMKSHVHPHPDPSYQPPFREKPPIPQSPTYPHLPSHPDPI